MNKSRWAAIAVSVIVPGGALAVGMWYMMTHCWHETGNPITLKGQTYVCCMKCGKEFDYDLKTMKRGAERARYSHRIARTRASGLDRPVVETEE